MIPATWKAKVQRQPKQLNQILSQNKKSWEYNSVVELYDAHMGELEGGGHQFRD